MKYLIYLAVATAITFWTLALSAQTVEIVTAQPKISPAEIYARLCEQDTAEQNKSWTEPSPIPVNVTKTSDFDDGMKWHQFGGITIPQ